MNEEEFLAIWQASQVAAAPLFYRLYYDDNGAPLFYSMEDKPGKYIEIDQATFNDPPKYVKIVDGKLQVLKINPVSKLHNSDEGTPCHPQNVSIVVDKARPHIKWSLK